MLLWTAVMLGLVGSLHCVGMCGPLALALPVPPGGGMGRFFLGRLIYNLGRVVTYGLMGVGFGLLGRTLSLAGFQQWVSLGLGILLLGGLLFSSRVRVSPVIVRLVGRLKGVMATFLRNRSMGALGVLGLLNGLLPCGLVYVACAGAAATGGVLSGFLYMILFGLGTVPMMLTLSLSGRFLHPAFRRRLTGLVPVAVGVVALLLVLRGMGLGIPYVSPDLEHIHRGSCCVPASAEAEAVIEPTMTKEGPP